MTGILDKINPCLVYLQSLARTMFVRYQDIEAMFPPSDKRCT
jgi:hypothetical protein